MWAREHGSHAKIVWNTLMQCAEIQFDLKPGDPRLKGWQEGRLPFEPKESVFLHRQAGPGEPYKAVSLQDLGVSGVIKWLDEGNLLSGRGRHAGLDAACKAADRKNQELEAAMERAAVENARDMAREHRREFFELPMVGVISNLETDNGSSQ